MISAGVNAKSAAVLARIRASMTEGKIDQAKALIPSIASPLDLSSLYIDRRYEALWPAIESWAGPGLDRQHAACLKELRAEWQSSKDFSKGSSYAYALRRAGANQAVVDIFLPLLDAERLTTDGDDGIRTLPSRVATSLVAIGRGDDAIALLRRLDSPDVATLASMRLNFSGNLAETQLMSGQASEAATTSAAWLATARSLGPEINRSAYIAMLRIRACALIEAGRSAEAVAEIAGVIAERSTNPTTALNLYACRGDHDAARALLIEHLEADDLRRWALAALQPDAEAAFTPYQRKIAAFRVKLRNDPIVQAAVAKVGRILPAAVGGKLPADFVPTDPAQRGPLQPGSL